jgi:2-keto-4-pentenoate hydratase
MSANPSDAPSTQERAIQRVADLLRCAENDGVPIPPVRTEIRSLEDAYAIQEQNINYGVSIGRRLVGAKIGLTMRALQKTLGVDEPIFGKLFADMQVLAHDRADIGNLIQPKAGAQIAFVLARAPDINRLTQAELISSVAYLLPAIEIVDTRIRDWDISEIDATADNALSALFVLGNQPVPLHEIDLRLCGMVLEKNGEPVSFGAGAACHGHPLNALAWLARKSATLGKPLQTGDVILSGVLGPVIPIANDDRIEARIEGLGSVGISFGRGR